MKSSNSDYLSRLDHLRFIAAVMVLFWHVMRFEGQVPTSLVPAFWPLSFMSEGHTGVALFMTLSGYIFQSLCRGREINFAGFLHNRILRIAPLFLAWTLYYFYTGTVDPSQLFIAILGLMNRGVVPGVGWTIIVEFQFYVLFPFLLIFGSRYGIRYFFGVVALLVLFRWGVWTSNGTVQELAYSTIFGRLDQFLLGMLACELRARYPRFFTSPWILLLLVFTWCAAYHRFDQQGGYFDYGAYPSEASIWIYLPTLEGLFYGLITAFYLGTVPLLPAMFDRGLAWLGMLSYSLYLNHPMAIQIASKLYKLAGLDSAGFWNATLFGLAAALPILLLMSVGTYYLIELPFLSLRKSYLKTIDQRGIAAPT
jgi:peptidoglycan/LPS O-acetylase OafA/YrhL